MKKRILFRADGNSEIGYGHVIRSLAIVSMINDSFECWFITVNPSEFISNEINKVSHRLIKIESRFDKNFIQLIDKDDIVVLDNYFFTTDFQLAIKEIGCKLVCIDDIHHTTYASDVVINHAPGIQASDILSYSATQKYLGIEYSMLRRPFITNQRSPKKRTSKLAIFICFGGADIHNIAGEIARKLLHMQSREYEVHMLAGDRTEISFEHVALHVYRSLTAEEIVEVIDMCDLAIVPASTVLFEVISRSIPAISGYYVDNQVSIYNGFKKEGLIFPYGDFNNIESIESYITNINDSDLDKKSNELQNVWSFDIKENYLNIFKTLATI